MRDYDELSKRLRHCPAGNPSICQLNYELEEGGFCQGCEIKFEAADAIEELLAAVPHWISVEERLPDDWKPVLAFDPIGNGEIGIAFVVGSLSTVVWRGVGFTNTAYPPSVTHWMPLPKAPKEVQDG